MCIYMCIYMYIYIYIYIYSLFDSSTLDTMILLRRMIKKLDKQSHKGQIVKDFS